MNYNLRKILPHNHTIIAIIILFIIFNSTIVVSQNLNLGDKIPNISLSDTKGKIIPISTLEGKNILIHFWASWDENSQKEFGYIKDVYKQHKKDLNLEIYSISLDNNKDNWTRSISQNKFNWSYNVSDLKAWNSSAVKTLGINSIPTCWLINEKGIIIKKDFRGAEIENIKSFIDEFETKKGSTNNNQTKISSENNNTKANTSNSVRLTVSAQGKTKEEAKYNALRDALERAFGTFISSNTQILNDELIKDEIVSISSGNIEHFDIKSEVQLPDGTYSNVVDVTVSINKLKSFCESKGIEVEFQGGLFAANIKLQKMNTENEKIVVQNMYEIIETLAKVGYDFSVEVREPRESYSFNNAYDVELIVGAKFNTNMVSALDILKTTISGLYLSSEEVATLKKQNTSVYPLSIGGASGCLRSFSSVISVKHLCERIIPYYSTKFELNNGLQKANAIEILSGKADRYKISDINVSKLRPEWPRDVRNNPRYGDQYSGIKNNYKLYRLNIRDGYSYVSKYVNSIPSVGKDMNRTYSANIYDDYNDNYLIEVSTTDISNTEIVFPIINVLTLDELSKVNEFKVSKVTN